jgi:hypothetical protein
MVPDARPDANFAFEEITRASQIRTDGFVVSLWVMGMNHLLYCIESQHHHRNPRVAHCRSVHRDSGLVRNASTKVGGF